jgi:hypothetical protein
MDPGEWGAAVGGRCSIRVAWMHVQLEASSGRILSQKPIPMMQKQITMPEARPGEAIIRSARDCELVPGVRQSHFARRPLFFGTE